MDKAKSPEPIDQPREAALFAAALECPTAARATFLDGACHGDPALRERLTALLAAHEQPATELAGDAESTVKAASEIEQPDEAVGQTLGRYKLLERVGEGGCGVVYVAEQTEPVRRRVALKVIKLGMDTKQVVARFEAERQALAVEPLVTSRSYPALSFLTANETTLWPDCAWRLRASARIALRSKFHLAACSWRAFRTSSTNSSFSMASFTHQFFRRANHGCGKSMFLADPRDGHCHFRVGDVSAVPRQQEVHSVNRSKGDVRRVGRGLRREGQRRHQRPRQCGHVVSDVELRQVVQRRQSLTRGCGISCRRFVQHQLRDEHLEVRPAALPPFAGDLLMARTNQIPTRPGREVAGHGRFEIEARFQQRILNPATSRQQHSLEWAISCRLFACQP